MDSAVYRKPSLGYMKGVLLRKKFKIFRKVIKW